MEPPDIIEVLVFAFSSFTLFSVAAYEATFAIISRSSLEKLCETGLARADLMLRIYEPRRRLRLLIRSGEALALIAMLASVFMSARRYINEPLAGLLAICLVLILFSLASLTHRLRFEVDGEETRIPPLAVVFVPFYYLFRPLTDLLDRLSSGDYSDEDYRAEKEEELRSIVESESESGVIEEGERDMIQSVLGFHDRVVREVMVPRVDVKATEVSATLGDLLLMIAETGHSRVPLYKDTLDHILGIVYAKDLLQYLVVRRDLNLATPLSELVSPADATPATNGHPFARQVFYIPETKEIHELLREFRSNRMRLAMVIDEYAGTAGLVTTEDLVEEIVGEIQDEFDEEEELYYWNKPNEILVADARMNIDDLNEMLETDLPSDGFETLGGYIYDYLGQIPDPEQEFSNDNVDFKVLKIDGQRISQVQLKRHQAESRKEVRSETS